jgi:hypothetical protein
MLINANKPFDTALLLIEYGLILLVSNLSCLYPTYILDVQPIIKGLVRLARNASTQDRKLYF